MRVAVAADHAGFPLKDAVIDWLRELGHEPVDFGTDSTEPVDYPDVIAPAAEAVAAGDCERGIVLGGSGTGEGIVANKIAGIRCVVASDPVTARLGREHNDANVLSMGARIVGTELARACVEAFMDGQYQGGRHQRRIDKISALERRIRAMTDITPGRAHAPAQAADAADGPDRRRHRGHPRPALPGPRRPDALRHRHRPRLRPLAGRALAGGPRLAAGRQARLEPDPVVLPVDDHPRRGGASG